MHTCSVLCAASSFITTPSHSGWFKTLAETVKPSLGSREHTSEGRWKNIKSRQLEIWCGEFLFDRVFSSSPFSSFLFGFFLLTIFLKPMASYYVAYHKFLSSKVLLFYLKNPSDIFANIQLV